MKFATKLTLSTLMVAAGSAFIAPPVHADGRHTEQLNSQFQPSTRTRAEAAAEAREANRKGQLAPRTVHVDIPAHASAHPRARAHAQATAPGPRQTATH